MNRALRDILYGTNTFEYETLLKLPMKDRGIALIGQTGLYLTFIFLFHLAFLPYYRDTFQSRNIILIIYGLMFFGIIGPSILTLISPSVFKYKKVVIYSSFIITAFGAGLLGAEVAASFDPNSFGKIQRFAFLGILNEDRLIFKESPPVEVFYTLGIAYFAFLFGMKFSLETINITNEKKIEVETEIALARQIQETINSPIDIVNDKFTAFGNVIPAKEVGGDYMELLGLNENTFCLAIGDVSGHDTASGLLMGMTKAAFDTEMKYESDHEKVMASLNNAVHKFSSSEKFVTFLIASFNFNNNSVVTSNAGHLPFLHFNAKENLVSELKPDGVLLGIIPDSNYKSSSATFSRDDVFVGITDGIIEARNKEDDEFGMERLIEIIKQNSTKSAKDIFQALISAQKDFSKKGTDDDVSVFVLKVN